MDEFAVGNDDLDEAEEDTDTELDEELADLDGEIPEEEEVV